MITGRCIGRTYRIDISRRGQPVACRSCRAWALPVQCHPALPWASAFRATGHPRVPHQRRRRSRGVPPGSQRGGSVVPAGALGPSRRLRRPPGAPSRSTAHRCPGRRGVPDLRIGRARPCHVRVRTTPARSGPVPGNADRARPAAPAGRPGGLLRRRGLPRLCVEPPGSHVPRGQAPGAGRDGPRRCSRPGSGSPRSWGGPGRALREGRRAGAPPACRCPAGAACCPAGAAAVPRTVELSVGTPPMRPEPVPSGGGRTPGERRTRGRPRRLQPPGSADAATWRKRDEGQSPGVATRIRLGIV